MKNTGNAHGRTIAEYAFQSVRSQSASFTSTDGALEMTRSASEEGDTIASVTYTDEAIAELIYMIEEEKLAGDVYEAFYDLYGIEIFANIAESEDQHFDALIAQAENLGIDVSAYLEEEAGEFLNEELQALYEDLIEQGSASVEDALEVGVLIEEKDMVDIAEAIDNVEDTRLADVYENLLDGSVNHLDAFEFALM